MRWNACISLMKELTIFSSPQLSFFMSVLHSFLLFYFTFIDFYYWILFWNSLLQCLSFCGNQLFDFYQLTGCHVMRDLGVGILETGYKQFYMCLYVCVYIRAYMYVRVNVDIRVYVCVYICMSVCVYVYVCMYMYIYICVYVCMYIYMHIYIFFIV